MRRIIWLVLLLVFVMGVNVFAQVGYPQVGYPQFAPVRVSARPVAPPVPVYPAPRFYPVRVDGGVQMVPGRWCGTINLSDTQSVDCTGDLGFSPYYNGYELWGSVMTPNYSFRGSCRVPNTKSGIGKVRVVQHTKDGKKIIEIPCASSIEFGTWKFEASMPMRFSHFLIEPVAVIGSTNMKVTIGGPGINVNRNCSVIEAGVGVHCNCLMTPRSILDLRYNYMPHYQDLSVGYCGFSGPYFGNIGYHSDWYGGCGVNMRSWGPSISAGIMF